MEPEWEDVQEVLQTLSAFSRMSKGHSPLQLESDVNSRSYNESPAKERKSYSPSHSVHSSSSRGVNPYQSQFHGSVSGEIPDKPMGSGRGKILQDIEKRFKSASVLQFDENIHSELREIGCAYSNDAIERNWGSPYSPSENSQFESVTSDDDFEKIDPVPEEESIPCSEENNNQEPKEVVDVVKSLEDLEIKGKIDSPKHSNSPDSNSQEVVENTEKGDISNPTVVDQPQGKPSKHGRHNRPRKSRNVIVLNMSNEPSKTSVPLNTPDSFLKPSKSHSYSAALGSTRTTSNPFTLTNNKDSIFSADDFPALG